MGDSAGGHEANLTRAEARARAERVSEVAYQLAFTLEEGSPSYRGRARVRFRARPGGEDARPIFLDFVTGEVHALRLDGEDLPGDAFDGTRIVLPDDRLPEGDHVVEVEYTAPFDRGGAGFYRFVDPADGAETMYTYSEPYDAHRFMPCFDQPDLKATFELEVTAPASWVVVSNTREESIEVDGGVARHAFPATAVISTYLFHLSAGRFTVYEDEGARIPARILCRESLAEHVGPDVPGLFEVTRRGFDFYEDYFEVPYAFGKYDQIFCPDFMTGAMENVGAVTIADGRYVFRHAPTADERLERDMVILHEMAHMWFGDLVTMRWWDGLWLNESFATYMSFLALPAATDHTTGWTYFDDKIRHWAVWQDELPTTHPIELDVPQTQGAFANFDGITYGKGCCVLKQLAFRLGDETFRKGVVRYLKKYRFGNTENHDFTDALADEAGEDLREWCRDWLFASGVNDLHPELEVEDGVIRRLVLRQGRGNGDAVLRRHHLRLGFFTTEGAHDDPAAPLALARTLDVVVSGEETEVEAAAGLPVPDLLHPNYETRAYVKASLDDASLAVAERGFTRVRDLRTQASLLDILWREVHDAELAAPRFVALATRALDHDPTGPVLEKLAADVPLALGRYMDAAARGAPADLVHARARARLEEGGLAPDARLLWFRLLRGAAFSPDALAYLERLLDGEATLPEVELDRRQRWNIVKRLARLRGPAVMDRVEAEEARDPSDNGRKSAFAARVSMPDADEKARAWDRFLEDTETATEFLKAGLPYLHLPDQGELMAPYAARYLEVLGEVAAVRTTMAAAPFARGLFPSEHADPDFPAEVHRALDAGEVPPALVRTVRESLDDLERLQRIRAISREAQG